MTVTRQELCIPGLFPVSGLTFDGRISGSLTQKYYSTNVRHRYGKTNRYTSLTG